MDDYVSFEIAKKLKEKNFIGNVEIGLQCGFYYKDGEDIDVFYDGFDNADAAADEYLRHTISQVLKWLREKYFIHISTKPYPCEDGIMWLYEIRKFSEYISIVVENKTGFIKEEQAALAGIEYVLDNLI